MACTRLQGPNSPRQQPSSLVSLSGSRGIVRCFTCHQAGYQKVKILHYYQRLFRISNPIPFQLKLNYVASALPFSTLRLTIITSPVCSWRYSVTYRPAKPILVAANIWVANRFTNSQGTIDVGDTNSSSVVLHQYIRLETSLREFRGEGR